MTERRWPDIEMIADGLALFQEHAPQTGEDWVKVAERFIADGCTPENSSPLFAAVVLAVADLDRYRELVPKLLALIPAQTLYEKRVGG